MLLWLNGKRVKVDYSHHQKWNVPVLMTIGSNHPVSGSVSMTPTQQYNLLRDRLTNICCSSVAFATEKVDYSHHQKWNGPVLMTIGSNHPVSGSVSMTPTQQYNLLRDGNDTPLWLSDCFHF